MVKKVMVVDDEVDLCETVKFLLEGKGFDVVTALNGPEALKKLKDERVDLVLIDLLMPRMSGRDLAETIRKDPKLKNMKLAFLTVVAPDEIGLATLLDFNVLDYIQKPFDNKDLVRRVKMYCFSPSDKLAEDKYRALENVAAHDKR